MKTAVILCLMLGLHSCSSLKKSITFGGITGASLGAAAGVAFSPDTYSKTPNALIWGGLGAVLGGALGYFLYEEDPENKELPSMILPPDNVKAVEYYTSPIVVPKKSTKYSVEELPLPDHLKGKVPKPVMIEHEIPEQRQQLDNNRTLIIDPHKAYEIRLGE